MGLWALDWTCPQAVEVEMEGDPGRFCAYRHPELSLLVSVLLARGHVEAVAWLPFSRIQNTKLVWLFLCGLDQSLCVSICKPCWTLLRKRTTLFCLSVDTDNS